MIHRPNDLTWHYFSSSLLSYIHQDFTEAREKDDAPVSHSVHLNTILPHLVFWNFLFFSLTFFSVYSKQHCTSTDLAFDEYSGNTNQLGCLAVLQSIQSEGCHHIPWSSSLFWEHCDLREGEQGKVGLKVSFLHMYTMKGQKLGWIWTFTM